ncbi:hypothetical protein [Aquimarina algicola]|uniref:Uncharacterized protein n=1 Tax=Aquimarina algicola TaxID=2589995 RepID=A0A504IVH5_9FLAO|nr:hypothetical protein [Aquimarina algicola]TPN82356.1 hypothetical protein FHK87_23325 [Aquimarina algicola]
MNSNTIKKVGSVLLIITGAIILLTEMYTATKNYYFQSIGIIFLMIGLFLINSNIKSKSEQNSFIEDKQEEEND